MIFKCFLNSGIQIEIDDCTGIAIDTSIPATISGNTAQYSYVNGTNGSATQYASLDPYRHQSCIDKKLSAKKNAEAFRGLNKRKR